MAIFSSQMLLFVSMSFNNIFLCLLVSLENITFDDDDDVDDVDDVYYFHKSYVPKATLPQTWQT